MSGLVLAMHLDGAPLAAGTIEAMASAIPDMAPAGFSHHLEGSAALGLCKPAMALPSAGPEAGCSAPVLSADGHAALVFDGYLANPAELRADLLASGARPRTTDDEELVLLAYQTWGNRFDARLEGEFAAVVLDLRQRRAVLLRDHMGLRPLLYYRDGPLLLAASLPAAIIAAMPRAPQLNFGMVAEIAAEQWFTLDETVWEGIHRLPPAHTLAVSGQGQQLDEYWTLPTTVPRPFKDERDYVADYRALLFDCVRRAGRTTGLLGCDVSGGLDSSAVFAVAASLERDGQLPARGLKGFGMAGPPGSEADEVGHIRAVAAHVGVPVSEVPLFMPDLAWFTHQSRRLCDQPSYPNAAMALGGERAARAAGCTAVLNGLGGDQWLDGTHYYLNELPRAGEWRLLGDRFAALRRDFGTRRALRLAWSNGLGPLVPAVIRESLRTLTNPNAKARPARYETWQPFAGSTWKNGCAISCAANLWNRTNIMTGLHGRHR